MIKRIKYMYAINFLVTRYKALDAIKYFSNYIKNTLMIKIHIKNTLIKIHYTD